MIEAASGGNRDLIDYLSQPFFVAEPWTSKAGETTEREEALERTRDLLAHS